MTHALSARARPSTDGRHRTARLFLAGLAVVLLSACQRAAPFHPEAESSREPRAQAVEIAGGSAARVEPPARPAEPSPVAVAPPPEAVAAAEDHTFGAPKVWDNLTVLPVLSNHQEDIGPITSLDDALAKKTAVVREMGSEPTSRGGEGARVNSLVIENKGTLPVYVLAGTIVKGGNQDRQIGDDFIVGAHSVVPVDAYCVEHGRWSGERDGVATGGQFGVAGVLTDSTVRTAAQYKHDQSEVWSKVADVNAAHRKEAASGTLMATVDAADVVARRVALTQKIDAYLRSVDPADSVVGFAYAVDGKVRSVRWFASHKVFTLFKGTLEGTAAMEAITIQARNTAAGKPAAPPPPMAPAAVVTFIDDIQTSRVKEERGTPAMNVNELRESGQGYSSSTMLKPAAGQPAAPRKKVSTSVSAF
jgi:hypothetical protein